METRFYLRRGAAVALGWTVCLGSVAGCDNSGPMVVPSDDGGSDTGEEPLPEGCRSGSDPEVVLGEGSQGFELTDGELTLVRGTQNFVHLLLGVRAVRIEAEASLVTKLVATVDGQVLATASIASGYRCNEETASLETSALQLVFEMNPDDVPAVLLGKEVVIEATVGNGSGPELTTQQTFSVLNVPPGD